MLAWLSSITTSTRETPLQTKNNNFQKTYILNLFRISCSGKNLRPCQTLFPIQPLNLSKIMDSHWIYWCHIGLLSLCSHWFGTFGLFLFINDHIVIKITIFSSLLFMFMLCYLFIIACCLRHQQQQPQKQHVDVSELKSYSTVIKYSNETVVLNQRNASRNRVFNHKSHCQINKLTNYSWLGQ